MVRAINFPTDLKVFDSTPENMLKLWNKIKDKDILFSDDNRGDFFSFYSAFRKSFVFSNEYGIVRVSNVVQGHRCEIHGFVLGKSLSEFADTMKNLINWLLISYGMRRIECKVPVKARALRRFLEDKIGFKEEGVLKDRLLFHGVLHDQIIYAITGR